MRHVGSKADHGEAGERYDQPETLHDFAEHARIDFELTRIEVAERHDLPGARGIQVRRAHIGLGMADGTGWASIIRVPTGQVGSRGDKSTACLKRIAVSGAVTEAPSRGNRQNFGCLRPLRKTSSGG